MMLKSIPRDVINSYVSWQDLFLNHHTTATPADYIAYVCSEEFLRQSTQSSESVRVVKKQMGTLLHRKLPLDIVEQYNMHATPHPMCDSGHFICTNCALVHRPAHCAQCRQPVDTHAACNQERSHGQQGCLENTSSMARLMLSYDNHVPATGARPTGGGGGGGTEKDAGGMQISCVAYDKHSQQECGVRPRLVQFVCSRNHLGAQVKQFVFAVADANNTVMYVDFKNTKCVRNIRIAAESLVAYWSPRPEPASVGVWCRVAGFVRAALGQEQAAAAAGRGYTESGSSSAIEQLATVRFGPITIGDGNGGGDDDDGGAGVRRMVVSAGMHFHVSLLPCAGEHAQAGPAPDQLDLAFFSVVFVADTGRAAVSAEDLLVWSS